MSESKAGVSRFGKAKETLLYVGRQGAERYLFPSQYERTVSIQALA